MNYLVKKVGSVLVLLTIFFSIFTASAFASTSNLSGKITNSSGTGISEATVNVLTPGTNNIIVSTTSTSLGDYALNVEDGTYDIQVIPPSGSNFNSSLTSNEVINGDTILDFVLVSATPITVSGTITDQLGNPLSLVGVSMRSSTNYSSVFNATTDSNGHYSISVPTDTYTFQLGGQLTTVTDNVPKRWEIYTSSSQAFTQDTTINYTLLVKRLNVHVQDAGGNPVSSAAVYADGPVMHNLTLDGVAANGSSSYPTGDYFLFTDSSSNTTLWLYATNSQDGNYTLRVDPPPPYTTAIVNDVSLTDDKTQVIVLQSSSQLTALSPAKVWVGLQNSQDKGIKYDLKAEAYMGNTLISSGELDSVDSGGAGFNKANLDTIPFNSFSPVAFPQGSQLSIKLYVRNACTGSKNNGKTARLWYNDRSANSGFRATIASSTNNYYLVTNSSLSTSFGTGPQLTSDVATKDKCAPFQSFGTWTITP